jgi:group I intron endonuclease
MCKHKLNKNHVVVTIVGLLIILLVLILIYDLNTIDTCCLNTLIAVSKPISRESKLYAHIIRFKSWPGLNRFKKHKAVDHCRNVDRDLTSFRRKWKGKGGIYKITYLPCRLFTYVGRTTDFASRFKYHYFNSSKQTNFLGTFLNAFGWRCFSITILEVMTPDKLIQREDWYLSTFKPLLNVETSNAGRLLMSSSGPSSLTRSKISMTMMGKKDSDATRAKKSIAMTGVNNPFYGIGPGKKASDLAAELSGTKVYAYDLATFSLVNGKPFRSIRDTAKSMPISDSTLATRLNSGKVFKGYYYYTSEQTAPPK